MKLWDFHDVSWFPKVLSLQSFGNSWDNSYIPCLLLIITTRFICGDQNILSNIKMSQSILTRIAGREIVFLSHLSHGSWIFLRWYIINWHVFIVWLPLFHERLDYIRVLIIWVPIYGVINSEAKLKFFITLRS